MVKQRCAVVATRLRGHRTSIETADWQTWLDAAGDLVARFDDEEDDDPFGYNETASVSLLATAAARAGFLSLAEFSVQKKHSEDRRYRSSGRSDFWMRSARRAWSFEFKQITYAPVTEARLAATMANADRCAGNLLRYGPEHMISGLIVPLFYFEIEDRAAARANLTTFVRRCDFAWHLAAPNDGPETFLFFNTIERPQR